MAIAAVFFNRASPPRHHFPPASFYRKCFPCGGGMQRHWGVWWGERLRLP